MFKFSFSFEEAEGEDTGISNVSATPKPTEPGNEEQIPSVAFQQVPLETLLASLPANLSYSSLNLGPLHRPLLRRDLFDARFQLMSDEDSDAKNGEVWGPETDLVKGVYEGGLKTWECSLDLVDVLSKDFKIISSEEGNEAWHFVEGKKIMEVGCGTAVPSLYLLSTLLSKKNLNSDKPPPTVFNLMDYNALVLQLVTLPNILLTWWSSLYSPKSSSSTAPFDPTQHRGVLNAEESDDEEPDGHTLSITPSLLERFKCDLESRNITINFFEGGWNHWEPTLTGGYQDLILTSETIYQSTSLSSLLNLLKQCSRPSNSAVSESTKVLVGAKVLYFGLEGGGVAEFERQVSESNGWSEVVWQSEVGVKRRVLAVGWGEKS